MEEIQVLEKLKNLLKILNQIWEDDHQLLSIFFQEMQQILQAKNIFLAFMDSTPNKIKFLEKEPDNFSRTIIYKTIQNNTTTFIPDTSAVAGISESVGRIGIRSIVCTPFHCSEAVQGAFYVDRQWPPGPFSKQECRFIEIICEQLAHIIQNSRIYREKLEQRIIGPAWQKEMNWGMIGQAPSMEAIFRQIRSLSKEEGTVLIIGETGTGKEMIARAIHYNSDKKKGNFVGINCAAIPSSLLESELFGYEQGAFSEAKKRKQGRFELAQCGTLLLDEMCEIPMDTQAKLLRVLQEREFERLGGTTKIQWDVRLISATNQEPKRAILAGKLRLDFYQRLAVHIIQVPPLRERKEDLVSLAQYFTLVKNGFLKPFSSEAIEKLNNYHWPGNIRELENTIERAVFFAKEKSIIHASDIQLDWISDAPDSFAMARDVFQTSEIKGLIKQAVKEFLSKEERQKPENLEKFILEQLETKAMSCRQLSQCSGYEKRTLQKILKKMLQENKIQILGNGKNILYKKKLEE